MSEEIDDQILAELYDLRSDQSAVWRRLAALVDEALDQASRGYAVDVEQQMADLAREFCP